ncbi:MAG: zinc ABC transporter substrate-binding protein [Pseudolabrys sp.]
MKIAGFAIALLVALGAGQSARAAEGRLAVVAAENFYGDIAEQIGGDRVEVVSIMNSPDQDPHLFETHARRRAPDRRRARRHPQWRQLRPVDGQASGRRTAARPHRHQCRRTCTRPGGDNPHLWYAPATMPAVAKAIAEAFAKADTDHASDYAIHLTATLASFERIGLRIAQIKSKHAGEAVTATEPVFGPMAEALGLTMRNQKFQLAMMNDTEPSARDVAAFENDLKGRKVKLLLYNSQVSEKLTERMRDIASNAKVPVVGVTETMPAKVSFQDWMLRQLDAVDRALTGPHS